MLLRLMILLNPIPADAANSYSRRVEYAARLSLGDESEECG
jgi:hypothetical protein